MSENNSQYSSWSVYRRILSYTKVFKTVLIIGVLANILFALVEATFAYTIKYLVDDGLVKQDEVFLLVKAPIFIIAAIMLRGVFSFIATYCMGWTGRRVVQTLREQLFEHYVYQPSSFYHINSPGNLLSTLTFNTEQIAEASSNAITKALRAGGMVIFIIMFMFYINWKLTLYLIFLVPLIGWLVNVSSKRLKNVSKNIQSSIGEVTNRTEQTIKAYQVIKMFGGADYEINKFKDRAKKNRQQDMKLIATRGLVSPVIQIIAGFGFALIIYLGSKDMLAGIMTAGDFTSYMVQMSLILKPLRELTDINTLFQRGIAGAQSVFEILDLPKEKDKGTKVLERSKGAITFDKVSFSYEQDKTILNNISFHAKPGQTIALVGRSGSGKTTIASLIQRLFEIDQGRLLIDDIPIEELTLDSLRKQIATVSQNVVLFNDTLRHNIAYGHFDQKVTDEQIIEAAKNAYAWDFIEQLPEQLDTITGDNGVMLSGGQRQRIAIARAILKDSPILILDEATSALDTESERHIQAALENLMKNKTTIVVAHRLSTIENADNILVISDGNIVESGTHKQLLANNGEYTRLHQMQFSDE